ncbi:MAG: response regulator [candidate division NC10 bacterium]|nr:response regulator [candidate division NC10 bacterium]
MPTPTILVVDDDKLIRWSVSVVLGHAGYRVQEAATGKDLEHRPDLVLLDIALPDLDGLSILEMLRKLRPDLPVLMMTADATNETARQAARLGARGQLDKPFDPTLLQVTVSEALKPAAPPDQPNG